MEPQKLNITVILAGVLATIIMTTLVSGLLTTSQRVQNVGSVTATIGLGVYSDQACTNTLTTINWGSVVTGQIYSRTIYVKNNGNIRVQLSMIAGNWTPSSAGNYLTLTWNRDNYVLNVGTSINATLTLTVLPTAQGGSFSFDISIIATEY